MTDDGHGQSNCQFCFFKGVRGSNSVVFLTDIGGYEISIFLFSLLKYVCLIKLECHREPEQGQKISLVKLFLVKNVKKFKFSLCDSNETLICS